MAIYDARPSNFTLLTTTSEWEALMSMAGASCTAIDGSVGSALVPSLDTPGRNAVMADGNASIKGMLWRCDAPVSTPIPAASAQNRIDRLVLRLTRGAVTSPTVITPTIITGTPSGSPAVPPLVQTSTGIYDIPVSHWISTSAGGLTTLIDDRRLTNDIWHDMRPLGNSFVGSVSGYQPPQYRFSDDLNWVEVAGYIQTPVTTGNNNSVPIKTFPDNYRPLSVQGHKWPVSGIPDGAATPVVGMYSTGNLQLNFSPTSLVQTTFGIVGRYPLDDQSGYLLS